MKRLTLQLLTIALFFSLTALGSTHHFNHSNIHVSLFNTKVGVLSYVLKHNNSILMDTSSLGITINNRILGRNVRIQPIAETAFSRSFPIFGIKDSIKHSGKNFRFQLTEQSGKIWYIDFHLSSQGVAFRYHVPMQGTNTVNNETSSFKLPNKTKVWYFERNSKWKLMSHAGSWLSADISEMPSVSSMGPIQGLTLTCHLSNKCYLLLGEANLFNYSGMRLKAIGNNTLRSNFTEQKGFKQEGDITTPWRCIAFAADLNSLVNNSLIPALNPKPDSKLFADKSWIKPGKATWFWWAGNEATYHDEKTMIDCASKLGFKYTMVDDGWESWPDKWNAVTQLVQYAKQKGVDIFLWKHSKEIKNPANNYSEMAVFLDHVKQSGAVGVKVDFMNGHNHTIIQFDEALLRKAAERQLMVNFHGCQQSSGEYVTYPNEITREGIRGVELNKMNEGPLSATHNAALPFTRLVAGHGDYTPLAFTAPGKTSWAHQLATLICFYSPFQCIAEDPRFILNDKRVRPALEFISHVPTVWDETVVLPQSRIGKLAAIARRKEKDWYVGILNANGLESIEIDCSFLSGEKYRVQILSDDMTTKPVFLKGLNPLANISLSPTTIPFKSETFDFPKKPLRKIKLAPQGGAVLWFKAR
ncbi:alpha-glucosidase [Prolixibacteraceae bacterium JC049]|nr:alpha-glucosidase [Prolixibacteraceae bacterium JC049]